MIYYFEIEINKTIEEKKPTIKCKNFVDYTNRPDSVCGYFRTNKK